ncbi:hypothetical protein [Brachybacterium kimchii]|uniref:Uncharacterized protein n=1 Tax=Brachybacterium kimchii TaxID=2942909 RepID=A0ABY4N0N8_9MICO|nr:hypothetical protein [Brachybacterium kimchii]UQN28107.1 hypothetical protein M4486_10625 [Brachybacterium kimchii]
MSRAQVLGRTRATFRMHWPWYLRLLPLVLVLAIDGLILLAGDRLAAVISFVLLFLLAVVPIALVLRSFAFAVTDRAIVIGPFLPGFPRTVVMLSDVDVSTMRTWRNLSAYLHQAGIPSLLTLGKINRGARGGISFAATRAGALEGESLTEDERVKARGGTIEILSATRSPEAVIAVIARAMADAGIAGEQQVLATALPPGTLSRERGAHLREIPGHPLPREQ